MALNLSELPELVLLNLFSYLSIKEKNRLKLVSKDLKSLVERFPQTRLLIYQSYSSYFVEVSDSQWPSGEWVKPTDFFGLKVEPMRNPIFPFSKWNFDLRSGIFSDVKYLYLKNIRIKKDGQTSFFDGLNCMEGLKVLVIERCELPGLEFIKLKLPLLKTLCLEFQYFGRLELNTPSLEELRLSDIAPVNDRQEKPIHFKYPESLKVFVCVMFEYKLELPNLETLICRSLRSDFDLSKLPRLKRLEVYPIEGKVFRLQSSYYYRMLSEKRSLAGNRNLEIRLFGFKEHLFTKSEINLDFDSFDFGFKFEDAYAQLLAQNYASLVSPMPYPVCVIFSRITKFFPTQLPDDFFLKFPFINSVQLDPLADSSRLIPFLEHAKAVTYLTIEKSLSKEFYDKLATTMIAFLTLYEAPESLSFLTRMNNLQSLNICKARKSAIGCISDFVKTMFKLKNFAQLVISKRFSEPSFIWQGANLIISYTKIVGFLLIIRHESNRFSTSLANLDKVLKVVKSNEESLDSLFL